MTARLATDSVAKTLDAVKGLGEVHLLVPGPAAAAAEAAKLDGVAKVLHAGDAAYDHGMAESIAALMVSLAGDYEHICGAATAFCKNVMPRVAALLDVMVMSDVTAVVDADTFERPIYAGNAIQTVKSGDAKKVFTVRTANFTAVGTGGSAKVEAASGPTGEGLSSWVEDKVAACDRPESDLGQDRRLRRPWCGVEGILRHHRSAGRQAECGRWCVAGSSGFGLCPERLAGRPDRQGRGAEPVHCLRHLGCDPASGRA